MTCLAQSCSWCCQSALQMLISIFLSNKLQSPLTSLSLIFKNVCFTLRDAGVYLMRRWQVPFTFGARRYCLMFKKSLIMFPVILDLGDTIVKCNPHPSFETGGVWREEARPICLCSFFHDFLSLSFHLFPF